MRKRGEWRGGGDDAHRVRGREWQVRRVGHAAARRSTAAVSTKRRAFHLPLAALASSWKVCVASSACAVARSASRLSLKSGLGLRFRNPGGCRAKNERSCIMFRSIHGCFGASINPRVTDPRNAVVRKFRPLRPGQNMTEAQHFMKDVANDQMGGVPRPVIAVVRDPVERFVSAASQLLNMKGRLRQCNGGNRTAELMKCAIDALVGGHRDPHFESMVADLHCIVGHLHDVQFSVYPMDTVPAVLNALGAENPNEKINSKNYKNIILKVSDMDEKMIRDVCQWYLADVTMMRSLGFSVPHC